LNWRSEARGEDIGGEFGVLGQQLASAAGGEHDEVLVACLVVADEDTGVGAVEDEDRGRAKPGFEVVDGERDVLREVFVEDPDL